MSRSSARLFKYAIEQNRLVLDGFSLRQREDILDLLEKIPIRGVKQLMKQFPTIIEKDLEHLCEELYSKFDAFYVVGCPLSTDLDVLCLVKEEFTSNGKALPLLSSEIERLESDIIEMGYPVEKVSKGLDINLMSINPQTRMVSALLRGGDETVNCLFATYSYHKQKYPLPSELNNEFIEIDILDKCLTIAKFFMDYLEFITIDYDNLRAKKKEVYATSREAMLLFSTQLLDHLDIHNKRRSMKWKDEMKTFTMKIAQLILLRYQQYEYNKMKIASKLAALTIDNNEFVYNELSLLWLLTRGTFGEEDPATILELYRHYVNILQEYLANIQSWNFQINLSTFIPESIYSESLFQKLSDFFESPNNPSRSFEDQWNSCYGEDHSRINQFFMIPSSLSSLSSSSSYSRQIFESYFPPEVQSNFFWCEQGSEEWTSLVSFYNCETNSKEIPAVGEQFIGKFTFIREKIAKLLISEYLGKMSNSSDPMPSSSSVFSNYVQVQIGLIVTDATQPRSLGCVPDLLLVDEHLHEIIPVEIKCLQGKPNIKNADYYDAFGRAQKQCKIIEKLCNAFQGNIVQRKMIVMSWFTDDGLLVIEVNKMNFL